MEILESKIFYLKKKLIFPNCTLPVVMNASMLSKNISVGDKIIAFPVRNIFDFLFYKNRLATYAEILEINKQDESLSINLRGLSRVKLKKISRLYMAKFEFAEQKPDSGPDKLGEELRKKAQELIFLINVDESDRLIKLLNYLVQVDQLADFISNYFVLDFSTRYILYNERDPHERGTYLLKILNNLIDELRVKRGTEQE